MIAGGGSPGLREHRARDARISLTNPFRGNIMGKLSRALLAILLTCGVSSAASAAPAKDVEFTHGPILGRPAPDSMAVWARTSRPAAIHVNYGTEEQHLTNDTPPVSTTIDHDLTAVVPIAGLKPRTKYFYE